MPSFFNKVKLSFFLQFQQIYHILRKKKVLPMIVTNSNNSGNALKEISTCPRK